jgi:hypothetical protein
MLEKYGYPEQSSSQVLKSFESCVACLGIERKSGENIQILYVMFYYHWLNFVKVLKSFINKYRIS